LAGDIVEITSSLVEIRDKSIRFLHEMHNAETGEIAATCEITGVHMDRALRRSTAFPPDIREVAAKHLVVAEPAIA
jgi:acyl-CoA thioester hydrolase